MAPGFSTRQMNWKKQTSRCWALTHWTLTNPMIQRQRHPSCCLGSYTVDHCCNMLHLPYFVYVPRPRHCLNTISIHFHHFPIVSSCIWNCPEEFWRDTVIPGYLWDAIISARLRVMIKDVMECLSFFHAGRIVAAMNHDSQETLNHRLCRPKHKLLQVLQSATRRNVNTIARTRCTQADYGEHPRPRMFDETGLRWVPLT